VPASSTSLRSSGTRTSRPDIPRSAPRLTIGIDPDADPIGAEFSEFYTTPRGYHHNAITQFTLTSTMAYYNFSLLDHIETISPRPILFVVGEHAHSRYFSEDAYERAEEPKELYVVPNAGHVDLYDKPDVIPFDKLEEFFAENLASPSSDSVGELVRSTSSAR
jgi:uncharacterized protein